MKRIVLLVVTVVGLSLAGAAYAAPETASPVRKCQKDCRAKYRSCVKAGEHGGKCFKERRACYRTCRAQQAPTANPNR